MLHIKLPKGKVAAACERAAEEVTRRIAVENDRYRVSLEEWRKDEIGNPPERPATIGLYSSQRDRLHAMADMAKHSTGDVYVSEDLWRHIKGWY